MSAHAGSRIFETAREANYADITDLALVDWLSGGKVDLTFGS